MSCAMKTRPVDVVKMSSVLLRLSLILTLISLSGCTIDVCTDYESLDTDEWLHSHATPKGNTDAGLYSVYKPAVTLESCLKACCDHVSTCDTMFFHSGTCYLITCNGTAVNGCDPNFRKVPKFENTYLVNVREHNDERFVGIGQTVWPDEHTSRTSRPTDRSCTYGLLEDCLKSEECIPRNSRSRVGSCHCVTGYVRDDDDWCVPDSTEDRTSVSKRPSTTSSSSTSSFSSAGTSSSSTKGNTSSATSTTTTQGPSTTTRPKQVEPLVVSVGGNKEIILPENSITLTAYTVPEAEKPGDYKYEWALVTHPEGDQIGHMDDINTAALKLSKLVPGLYTFKVTVSAEGKYGEALVNVTVLNAARKNLPPVSVINPKIQRVNQPNNVVLDGSMSTDDDHIVKYQWEQVSGPLNSHKQDEDVDLEQTMLVLKGLGPGNYTFKLTVTDSDGLENSTLSNVTVVKDVDYPPKANAGSNVIISLPQNTVTLYGNASTDDKGIDSYEWLKKSGNDQLTVDMTGTRSPLLHLENLEEGDYTFTLKVTDTSGQTSTADVHVFVKPEHNKPPVARSGKSKTVWLPATSTTLDGSNSTDDQKITKYTWTQIMGPSTIAINNADRAVATASKLIPGVYKFKLTVADEEDLQSSDVITISVRQNENHPPVANAGGDHIVNLPLTLVTLDGSQSSDDKGIVSYKWTRDEKSPAAGEVLNHSDTTAVLQLINVVAGRYVFSLEVADAEGVSATDTASIIIREDEHSEDIAELHLKADIGGFTEANKRSLENQLALLLHKTNQEGETRVYITRLDDMPSTGQLSVKFYTATKINGKEVIQRGTDVVTQLKKKLRTDTDMIDFRVTLLDTYICQNNCSGHGHCDSHTKQCICEAFWMEDLVRLKIYGESNCDWSVLYVIIIAFMVVVGLAGIVWGLVCLVKRCYRWRPKKRHRYTLLDELEDDKEMGREMLPRGGTESEGKERQKRRKGHRRPMNDLSRKIQNSSLMISESDFSSDQETLFVNKKINGHVKNGLVKSGKNKVKT